MRAGFETEAVLEGAGAAFDGFASRGYDGADRRRRRPTIPARRPSPPAVKPSSAESGHVRVVPPASLRRGLGVAFAIG